MPETIEAWDFGPQPPNVQPSAWDFGPPQPNVSTVNYGNPLDWFKTAVQGAVAYRQADVAVDAAKARAAFPYASYPYQSVPGSLSAQSMFAGIPTWVLLAGGALLVFMMVNKSKKS
jgi:hypothetical protein